MDTVTKARWYLEKLCAVTPNRRLGSPGNREAAGYVADAFEGWEVDATPFACLDHDEGRTSMRVGEVSHDVRVSPYSPGCEVTGTMAVVETVEQLAACDCAGQVLLMHGAICAEQLMPKNFVFYNPDHHRQILSLLEAGAPAAILCATGRNPSVAGGVYPFPLIEDGDFDIPSVYMKDVEGARLLPFVGETVQLQSHATRLYGSGANILALKGNPDGRRIVITAHFDAKKGTPGAIDNASGAAVLLLLAGLLHGYSGPHCIEITALNGEDYYAVPGQMLYIRENDGLFDDMLLNINIDGAGYFQGPSAFSCYQLPEAIESTARDVFSRHPGIVEGPQWVQSDHSIFVQCGCPALALSSLWLTENMDSQQITHTPGDSLDIVDCSRLVELAEALNELSRSL